MQTNTYTQTNMTFDCVINIYVSSRVCTFECAIVVICCWCSSTFCNAAACADEVHFISSPRSACCCCCCCCYCSCWCCYCERLGDWYVSSCVFTFCVLYQQYNWPSLSSRWTCQCIQTRTVAFDSRRYYKVILNCIHTRSCLFPRLTSATLLLTIYVITLITNATLLLTIPVLLVRNTSAVIFKHL